LQTESKQKLVEQKKKAYIHRCKKSEQELSLLKQKLIETLETNNKLLINEKKTVEGMLNVLYADISYQ